MGSLFDKLRNKIIWKIFLIFWITTLGIIAANIFITTEIVLSESRVEQLKNKATFLARDAVRIYEEDGRRALTRWYKMTKDRDGIKVVLINEDGSWLGLPPKWEKHLRHDQDDVFKKRTPFNHMLRVMDQKIISASGSQYTLKILPSRGLESRFGPPAILHVYRIGVTFLILLLGSWWLARSIAKPVRLLQVASQDVANGKFDVHVSEKVGRRRDELGDLARAFDDMSEKVAQLLESQRQLFSDISHDIRTPLTRQKLAIELARELDDPSPMLDKLEGQNQIIEDLLDSLLTLLKLDDVNVFEYTKCELEEIVSSSISRAELDIERKGIELVFKHQDSCFVSVDRALLTRAMDNLLSNAIKFSPAHSRIDIVLEHEDHIARVRILDQGDGIREEELDSVLQPFYRADKSRSASAGGYGLGLAIVNKIIQQHHGELRLRNHAPAGLEVILSLPCIDEAVSEA